MLKHASRSLCLALLLLMAGCNTEGPATPIVFVGPANLVISDVRVGTGATLAAGQRATVHYALWLYDPSGTDSKGTLIEDSRQTSAATTGLTISIATGTVIQGWVEGLPGMNVGGLRRLIIPPSLAYGTTGNGPIPPNSWIVFDVDLLAIPN
jgi:FKBP-type peptidyl-prolyl cis-trans isomerase FkpA